MFAGLIAGLKSIRTSLLNGYGVILIAWLNWPWFEAFRERAELGRLSESDLGQRLAGLIGTDNTSAQLGALTFAAATLGAAVNQLFMSRFLDELEKTFRAPNWTGWSAPKLDAVRSFGHIKQGVRGGEVQPYSHQVVHAQSHFYEQHLWEEYLSAQRDEGEARFRLNLLVLLAVVGLSIFWMSVGWFLVALGVWATLGGELRLRWRTVTQEMTSKRLLELNEALADAFMGVRKAESDLGPRRRWSALDSLDAFEDWSGLESSLEMWKVLSHLEAGGVSENLKEFWEDFDNLLPRLVGAWGSSGLSWPGLDAAIKDSSSPSAHFAGEELLRLRDEIFRLVAERGAVKIHQFRQHRLPKKQKRLNKPRS